MNLTRNTLASGALIAALCLPLHAHAADACKLEITANDQIQYDKQELSAPASCKQVTVTLHNAGKLAKEVMGHNWVLVNAADFAAVATAGMGAGPASDYVPPNDKRVIAHTKLVGGGESSSVTFSTAALKRGGAYKYLCTFPGHNALMHGVFKLT